jgi:hypothetical protein
MLQIRGLNLTLCMWEEAFMQTTEKSEIQNRPIYMPHVDTL